jgi:ribosomal silencing factor RsfS
MLNDYLSNKKKFIFNQNKKNSYSKHNTISRNVDINKLINEIKISKKNEKKESWVLIGLATLIVGVMGIFITL